MKKKEYKKPVIEIINIVAMDVLAVSRQSFGVNNGTATGPARSKVQFWDDME